MNDHDHCDICWRQVPTFDQQALIGDPERLCHDCWADVYGTLKNGRRVAPRSISVLRREAEQARAAEQAHAVELARAAAAAESAAALSRAAERIFGAGAGAP